MTDILFWLQCSVSPALSVPDLADVTDTAHVVRTETVNTERNRLEATSVSSDGN